MNFLSEIPGRFLAANSCRACRRVAALCAAVGFAMTVPSEAAIDFTYNSATEIPVSASSYTAIDAATLALNFAPPPGTNLTLVRNTGLGFIIGTFSNIAQGQEVLLSFGGANYRFVANYFGGSGNDLVLQWANTRLLGWGGNPNATPQRVMSDVSALAAFAGKTIIDVAAGNSHQLALCSDGSLIAWGDNTYGQLGNGYSSGNGPVQVVQTGVLSGKTVVAISAGRYHSVALCSDGSIASWGDNGSGQLGDGTRLDRNLPVLVDRSGVLAGKQVVAIRAGQTHTLAMCSDGFLAAWGSNQYSQLGNASYAASTVPIPVNLTGALSGKTIVDTDVGSNHSVALCADGSLAAWGYNSNGQLGNGNTVNSNVPVQVIQSGVLSGKTVTAVSCGNLHSMVSCSDGTLASWGRNNTGQLGNGGTSDRSSPVLVSRSGVLSARTALQMNAGFVHSMAVCTDGTLAAWGYNQHWQLGVNTSLLVNSTPVLASTTALRPGERFMTCTTGDIANTSFALVASPPAPTAITLAATEIRDTRATLNGTVNAADATTSVTIEYGLSNSYGSIVSANPATVSGTSTIPVSAPVSQLVPDRTYHYRVVASNANGLTKGEDMTFTTSKLCTLEGLTVSAGIPAPAFSASEFHYFFTVSNDTASITVTPIATDPSAAISVKGTSTGSGSSSPPMSLNPGDNLIPVAVISADKLETITYMITVTRLPENLVYGSAIDVPVSSGGFSLQGNKPPISLGFPPAPGTRLTVLENTGPGFIHGEFADLAHGQTILLTYGRVSYAYVANYHGGTGNDLVLEWAGNRLLSWGDNSAGQLGNNTLTARLRPSAVLSDGVLAGKTIIDVAAGEYHSLALCSDGTLATWGRNDFGQLGNNSTKDSLVPVAVDVSGALAGRRVIAIGAGGYNCAALCSDGGVVTWGNGSNGQLGVTGLGMSSKPVNVVFPGTQPTPKAVGISVGAGHTVACRIDGSLVSWGLNQYGQLGNSNMKNSAIPVAPDRTGILSGKQVVSIGTGYYNTYALCSDGTWTSWGYNWEGQLGNGTAIHSSVPIAIDLSTGLSGKSISRVFAGSYHCLALCSDGSMAGWGNNYGWQIGGGDYVIPVPTIFPATGFLPGKTVAAMSPGGGFSMAACADGTLASWGFNGYGQLGENSMTNRTSPVAVSNANLISGERFVSAEAGSFHCMALVATPPPVVTASEASRIMSETATLNGFTDAKGNVTSVLFEYGLDSNYGASIPTTPSTINGSGAVAVHADLSGLSPATTYHYRLVATNRSGISRSEDMTFITNRPPTAIPPGLEDQQMAIGQVMTIELAARFTDIEGDKLNYSLLSNSDASKVAATLVGTSLELRAIDNGVSNIAIQVDDGRGGNVVEWFAVGVGTLTPTPLMPATPSGGFKALAQNGLFNITVQVENTTSTPINGFRLHVDLSSYLSAYPSLRLYNASSPVGSPDVYVDYPYPVALDGVISMKLSFYTSTRTFPNPFAPGLSVEILQASQLPDTNGSGVQPRVVMMQDGAILLEFPSLPGRWYRVRYSSDMVMWSDCPVPLQAAGTRMQWIDSGPPFTNVPPSSVPSRFYVVNEILAP